MTQFHLIATIIAIAGLTAAAVCAIVRIVRGPTILDRMVASDMLLTTVVIAVGVDMVLRGHTENIPLMTAIAATAVLATVVVARYVRRRSSVQTTDAALPASPGPDKADGAENRDARD